MRLRVRELGTDNLIRGRPSGQGKTDDAVDLGQHRSVLQHDGRLHRWLFASPISIVTFIKALFIWRWAKRAVTKGPLLLYK